MTEDNGNSTWKVLGVCLKEQCRGVSHMVLQLTAFLFHLSQTEHLSLEFRENEQGCPKTILIFVGLMKLIKNMHTQLLVFDD